MDKMKKLITRLEEKDASLVVLYRNDEIKEYYNKRVIDIVNIIKIDKNALSGACVADKIIGKTAASLLAISGVKEIYAGKLSKFAIPVLEKYNIKYSYGEIIEYVINNDKTGMCPMENKFKYEENIQVIYDYFVNR